MPTEWMLPTELELRRRGLRPLNTDLANDVLISRTRKLLAEKEKEQKEEKERWTHIESVLNKHIGNCLVPIQA